MVGNSWIRGNQGLPQLSIAYEDILQVPLETTHALHRVLREDHGLTLPEINLVSMLLWIDTSLHRNHMPAMQRDLSLSGAQALLYDALVSGTSLQHNYGVPTPSQFCLDTLRNHVPPKEA